MNQESLKVPQDRLAVLIGSKGTTKKDIEKKGKVKLEIDSESGEVEVNGKDVLKLLKSQSVIKAIARGFSPEKAFKLFEDDYLLDIIDISELTSSKKEIENLRGRIIGKKGKAREKIEEKTKSFISVYGKTVSIIAKIEEIQNTRKAVEMLLKGASHSRVYSALKEFESTKFELD